MIFIGISEVESMYMCVNGSVVIHGRTEERIVSARVNGSIQYLISFYRDR